MRYFIHQKFPLQQLTIDGLYTPLMLAAKRDFKEISEILIEAGANPNDKNKRGQTAIFIALEASKPDMVTHLVSRGGDLNFQDETGATPLHHISTTDNIAMLKFLLSLNPSFLKVLST